MSHHTVVPVIAPPIIFTEDELKNTPSRISGIDEETETLLRIYGCELIQEFGILMKLPEVTMATAQVLFHRFYQQVSFRRFDVQLSALACIFLASKVEEHPRKIRDAINVFHRMMLKREGIENPLILDTSKSLYWDLKNALIKTERFILKELGFLVYIEVPQRFISFYTKILNGPKELPQRAWPLVNDCLRTTVCIRFRPESIAAASIYMAARYLGLPLPEVPEPWWELFDTTWEEIEAIVLAITDLYSRPKAKYIDVTKLTLPHDTSADKEPINGYFPNLRGGTHSPLSSQASPINNNGTNINVNTNTNTNTNTDTNTNTNTNTDANGNTHNSSPSSSTSHKEKSSKEEEKEKGSVDGDKEKSKDKSKKKDKDKYKKKSYHHDDKHRDRDKDKDRHKHDKHNYNDKDKSKDKERDRNRERKDPTEQKRKGGKQEDDRSKKRGKFPYQ
eukprot:TRINITY_DN4902_c0_g2_i1.p1 TRINITY_DN4902_c0_g2~~TRINITY_DN4902_c0_g2_i1.p1  ORF type:complete len:448 (-),score=96.41 TRINITY_DN4902_c0_g2_i1:12-1355(-)